MHCLTKPNLLLAWSTPNITKHRTMLKVSHTLLFIPLYLRSFLIDALHHRLLRVKWLLLLLAFELKSVIVFAFHPLLYSPFISMALCFAVLLAMSAVGSTHCGMQPRTCKHYGGTAPMSGIRKGAHPPRLIFMCYMWLCHSLFPAPLVRDDDWVLDRLLVLPGLRLHF